MPFRISFAQEAGIEPALLQGLRLTAGHITALSFLSKTYFGADREIRTPRSAAWKADGRPLTLSTRII